MSPGLSLYSMFPLNKYTPLKVAKITPSSGTVAILSQAVLPMFSRIVWLVKFGKLPVTTSIQFCRMTIRKL